MSKFDYDMCLLSTSHTSMKYLHRSTSSFILTFNDYATHPELTLWVIISAVVATILLTYFCPINVQQQGVVISCCSPIVQNIPRKPRQHFVSYWVNGIKFSLPKSQWQPQCNKCNKCLCPNWTRASWLEGS